MPKKKLKDSNVEGELIDIVEDVQEKLEELKELEENHQQSQNDQPQNDASEIPKKIVMLESYKIEAPLPGRNDVFTTVYFKPGQIISDIRTIKLLIAAKAPYQVVEG